MHLPQIAATQTVSEDRPPTGRSSSARNVGGGFHAVFGGGPDGRTREAELAGKDARETIAGVRPPGSPPPDGRIGQAAEGGADGSVKVGDDGDDTGSGTPEAVPDTAHQPADSPQAQAFAVWPDMVPLAPAGSLAGSPAGSPAGTATQDVVPTTDDNGVGDITRHGDHRAGSKEGPFAATAMPKGISVDGSGKGLQPSGLAGGADEPVGLGDKAGRVDARFAVAASHVAQPAPGTQADGATPTAKAEVPGRLTLAGVGGQAQGVSTDAGATVNIAYPRAGDAVPTAVPPTAVETTGATDGAMTGPVAGRAGRAGRAGEGDEAPAGPGQISRTDRSAAHSAAGAIAHAVQGGGAEGGETIPDGRFQDAMGAFRAVRHDGDGDGDIRTETPIARSGPLPDAATSPAAQLPPTGPAPDASAVAGGTGTGTGLPGEDAAAEMFATDTTPGVTRQGGAGQASAPVPSLHTPEVARQAALQIAEVVRASGDRAVELRLQPEELGRVQMTLSQDATGALNVALNVERTETLDLLRRNIDLLSADLRDLGYQGITFSFQGGSGDGRSAEGRGDGAGGSMGAEAPAGDLAQTVPDARPVSPGDGIDIRL